MSREIEVTERDGEIVVRLAAPADFVLRAYDVGWALSSGPRKPRPQVGSGGVAGIGGAGAVPVAEAIDPNLEELLAILDWQRTAYGGAGSGARFSPFGPVLFVRDGAAHQGVTERLLAAIRETKQSQSREGRSAAVGFDPQVRHRPLGALTFRDDTFAAALEKIGSAAKVPIRVQWDRVRLFSDVTPTMGVERDSADRTLGGALDDVLRQVNGDANPMRRLAWTLEEEGVVIGMPDELSPLLETRVYWVEDILDAPPPAGDPLSPEENMSVPEHNAARVTSALESTLYGQVGARCWNGLVVVTCSRWAHDSQVERVLRGLRER